MPVSQDYVISRNDRSDDYALWRLNTDPGGDVLARVPGKGGTLDHRHDLISIGAFVIEWGPVSTVDDWEGTYPYRLLKFDPEQNDPLQDEFARGNWEKRKFWAGPVDFSNPRGAMTHTRLDTLELLPVAGGYVLNMICTPGRGTFRLFSFDAGAQDPLGAFYVFYGAFDDINDEHKLLPVCNYVIDWMPATGEYWLWSFDPQNHIPLVKPHIQHGWWSDIGVGNELIAIGEHVLEWQPANGTYRLWAFDPTRPDPLTGPVKAGTLPAELRVRAKLTGVQAPRTVDRVRVSEPGTMDFMREKIKHVVYLMLENRSFDHICGWLYEQGGKDINFVGSSRPFDGASTSFVNEGWDDETGRPSTFALMKFQNGELGTEQPLDFIPYDPYHDKADFLRQYFYKSRDGYGRREKPNMGGFVWNNGDEKVMWTYTPTQIPVLNGLAKHYAISDEWFCSMPGATNSNRAFAFGGSATGMLNNFQSGPEYTFWNVTPRRQTIWKVLWNNGYFMDWKIYHQTRWKKLVHTYQLYLRGQIPTLDKDTRLHVQDFEHFRRAAKAGELPRFSMLEPFWIGSPQDTSSYHPGASLVVAEQKMKDIYDILRTGAKWDETLFIITFDEHGGFYDHVPPPYAIKPWPNDVNDGFRYDLLGVRVPTILISPWIKKNTVFRSPTDIVYDSTSILATVLEWFGVPRAQWGLGDRTHHAPTFEGVLQCTQPRTDLPTLELPYDSEYHQGKVGTPKRLPNSQERSLVPQLLAMAAPGMSHEERLEMTRRILAGNPDVETLSDRLDEFVNKVR